MWETQNRRSNIYEAASKATKENILALLEKDRIVRLNLGEIFGAIPVIPEVRISIELLDRDLVKVRNDPNWAVSSIIEQLSYAAIPGEESRENFWDYAHEDKWSYDKKLRELLDVLPNSCDVIIRCHGFGIPRKEAEVQKAYQECVELLCRTSAYFEKKERL
jgi:hypothetical protein